MTFVKPLVVCAAILSLAGCEGSDKDQAQSTPPPAQPASTATVPAQPKATTADTGHPQRVYWGDQHVHTGWSADAGLAGTRLTPEDAVRFARGEAVKTNTGQTAQLHRAMDWVAVTDHSDGMGTIDQIMSANPEMMADPTVKRWHDMMAEGEKASLQAKKEAVSMQAEKSLPKVLMDPKWMVSAWQKNVDIMEKYNDPGKFTTFIAYEWTSNGEDGQNLHRNVIFRDNGDKTRDLTPLTTFISAAPGRKGTDPESLWAWLTAWEAKTGGHVLAIPHNGNMSNGWMFREARYDGSPLTPEWAQARARWEPLVEIFQYKGQGEAHPMLSQEDEFANFEIWDTANLNGVPKKPGDINYEYAREALKNGMKLEATLGTNPFKFGMVSGTDTHTGLSAGGEEDNFWGKFPQNEPSPDRWKGVYKKEGSKIRLDWTLSAMGLTGVWATSNTRPALWDAMKRKEVYASSGPRMVLRFFGGYEYTDADAKQGDVAPAGYAKGVPMGGDLAVAPQGKSPTFIVYAMKDPDGANLDRVQVVKGWVDAQGQTHEKIYDVVWSDNRKPGADGKLPPVGDTVDVATAKYANTIGAAQLQGLFVDPDFHATDRAFYYARVIEIPTPRWTDYDTVRYHVKMDKEVPMEIQERAVSSPIWYEPGRG
jgi:hypothetical protein